MIDGKNFFGQTINSKLKTYENFRKFATGYEVDYTPWCLLDYTYFKDYYKMVAIEISKQQALDADPRAIQQTNFTTNLERAGNTTISFSTEEVKKKCVSLFTRNCKSFVIAILLSATSLNILILINIKRHNTPV